MLSPLFEEEILEQKKKAEKDNGGVEMRRKSTFTGRTDSEISIFLVCAELRVAFSMCQYFSKLPHLITSENK